MPPRVHLQPAREARLRRLDVLRAPSIRFQPSASTISGARHVAAVRVHHRARAPVRPSPSRTPCPAPRCSHSSVAQRPVVEGRERPAAAASARVARGVWHEQRAERLPDRAARARGCAATRSGPRTRTSGARRSRSGRAPAPARRSPRSSRATARPANEAPQIEDVEVAGRAGSARRRAWWLGRASEGHDHRKAAVRRACA